MIKIFPDADEDDSLNAKQSADKTPANENDFEEFAAPFSKIENETGLFETSELKVDSPESEEIASEPESFESSNEIPKNEFAEQATIFESNDEKNKNTDDAFLNSAYQPESSAETIRKSGLAYSAAIILFGSIVFTLILGWFADLLFGISPWGKVGGIVLGSIIGFIQFFRATSQILKDKD